MIKRRFLLGLTLILLTVWVMTFLSYIPNPLIKPYMSTYGAILDTEYNFLMVFVAVHNPTHGKHTLTVENIELKGLLTDRDSRTYSIAGSVSHFWGGITIGPYLQISDIAITRMTLDPCEPISGIVVFHDILPSFLEPSTIQKGTAHIEAQVLLDSHRTVISGGDAVILVDLVFPSSTTTTTSTTTRNAEVNECLLPWSLTSAVSTIYLGAVGAMTVLSFTGYIMLRRREMINTPSTTP